MAEEFAPDWLSFHLYYHEDLNRAVQEFVAPVVKEARHRDWVDRFFYLRFSLGGPHVRLRLRTMPGTETMVAETVRRAGELFLSRSPSTRPFDEELIRSTNRAILEEDPHETDPSIYRDNTLLPVPFRPETDRYGGPDQLALSFDAFTASSLEALRFLESHHQEPRSRQLVLALRVLLRQALYFARDGEELAALLGHTLAGWGGSMPGIREKGEDVFARQAAVFGRVFEQEVADLALLGESRDLTLSAAMHRLSHSLSGQDPEIRLRVAGSNLHTTANRLGLSNPEEVYMSSLLTASARQFLTVGSAFRGVLEEALASRQASPPPEGDLPLPGVALVSEAQP